LGFYILPVIFLLVLIVGLFNVKRSIPLKYIIIIIGILAAIFLYTLYSPYQISLFPKCPFLLLTGYKCPGCGSQRAIHYLLNFDVLNAMNENLILVLSIPYVFILILLERNKIENNRLEKIRNILIKPKAIYIVLILIVGFWILRNITYL
jgi:hypothetical protein